MSAALITPATPEQLADAVRSAPRVVVVGAGTKPRLAQVADTFARISTAKLRGIVEYEPSEFTFTALAGTPLREIAAALADKGQYLPFEPMLAGAGATLGGTVAAGLSGPGRFRFGGLRDFILGVRFVDGEGRLLRLGGKVVKNAAGFDVPKFLVGGLGRFGGLAEITFKVFPRPTALRTLRIDAADDAAKLRILTAAGGARWELDALDTVVGQPAVLARIGGPPAALDALCAEILGRFPGRALADDAAAEVWRGATEFAWAPAAGALAKFALTPAQTPEFSAWVRSLPGGCGWIGAGGNVGYASAGAGANLSAAPWPGVTLRGHGPLWLGPQRTPAIAGAVKHALDPQGRFPALND
ncbi:MAG: FAD-binding protein [Opitutaceae bacterium]|nr:FAD-binding protein [Opitutaceae bacterium]